MARGRGACPTQVLEAQETFGAPGPLARPVGSRRDDGEERVATGRVRPCAAPPRYALRGGTGTDFAAPGNASENGVNAHRAGNGIGGRTWAATHGASSGLFGRERSRILDQVIFNVLVANTDAHAKNYALLLNGGHARLAPLYDVSCVLFWTHIDQNFAQRIAGKKRKPGDIAPRHWETIARESGFNEHHVRERVEQMIDRIFRSGPEVAAKVAAMPGVHPGTANIVRDMVQANALRIAGRFRSSPRPVSRRAPPAKRPEASPVPEIAGSRKDDVTEFRP